MGLISENKANTLLDRGERKDILEKAKEAKKFVERGNDPRDFPKYLRVDRPE